MLLEVGLIFVIVVLVWFIGTLDCDLTLLWYDKMGKPIDCLKNKVIWITGASSGIGESLAYNLAKVKPKLILSGTNLERLKLVKNNCINLGLNEEDVLILCFDIRDVDNHKKMFSKALNCFKKVDILVNNSGKSQREWFEKIELDVDKELFNINVFGVINLTRIVVNHWYKENFPGHCICVTSTLGKIAGPMSASYTGTKHALHGYFETIRIEGASRKIKVTLICPGPVISSLLKNAFTGKLGETVGKNHDKHSKRMPTDRCAHLIAVAIANKIDECWLEIQPILTIHYMYQYLPSISRSMIPFVSSKFYEKLRDGDSLKV